jgi:predicted CoA-binding protein
MIEDFLAQRHIAFVGVSRDTRQFANTIYRRLRRDGRILYPVNPAAAGNPIEGDRSYGQLADVPNPVDGAIVMVSGERAATVVRQAVQRGIPRVWLYRGVGRGSVTEEAVQLCHDNGTDVVEGACPLMFDEPVRGIHRIHRLMASRRIAN